MTRDELHQRIGALSKPGKGFRPHKYLALLAVVQLIREKRITSVKVCFDADFRERFRGLLAEHGTEYDRNRPHAPFFHLSSSGFWRLVPKEGKDQELRETTTVGSTGALTQLVSHAELDESVFALVTEDSSGAEIEASILDFVGAGQRSRMGTPTPLSPTSPSASLFAHERQALSAIEKAVKAHQLGRTLENLEIHDPQSNRYFETDVVLIAEFGIYVVELKHWSGRIEVRPNSWVQNRSFFKPDPHKANGFKAKLLRGLYEHKFPAFPGVYVESVVVFTNPEATIDGASVPRTTSHNPTLDSIDRFIDYLKHQRATKPAALQESHVGAFTEYLSALTRTARPRDFVFPGYEIVERLYHHDDRAEVVARPTDVRHRRLSRLRIFFPPEEKAEAKRRVAHERATATLNAVSKIGNHPNVLKVWSVPNEYGYTVEGSDWSETGTLRDCLDRDGAFSPERVIAVAGGILRGLGAAHCECVIHRFLSPENILMDGETPKLMNFDLSYQLEEERTTVIPDATELKRSAYVAPEVYSRGPLTEAADLFSVGVIMYEMLTGERPFACSTDLERTGGRLGEDRHSKLVSQDLPEHLASLVLDLVQLTPGDRPSQVTDVLPRLSVESPPELQPPQVNPELSPGTAHDVFEIEELVARGVESQIYRARGPQGRLVAIKLFNADVALPRILSEQQFVAAVRHPCIVRVDNSHRWGDGRFYLPFDWIPGRSLRAQIETTDLPDVDRFSRVAMQLLEALQLLHAFSDDLGVGRPILHNDIKPENILLDETGRAVIIDFGSSSHPRVGLYEGTEGYVAPDLRLGQDRCYNEDGDLYALGVTLFEWFSGVTPYETTTIGAMPRDLPNDNRAVPAALVEWFRTAVATESRDRFAAARDMANALTKALTSPPQAVEKMAEPSAGEAAAPRVPAELEKEPPPAQRLSPELAEVSEGNPFVPYLNSLHSRDADSENALAESQARNPLFSLIHVPHPVTDVIENALLRTKQHVILTGHAGDGKSSIGIELYKRLRGLAADAPLEADLPPRVDVDDRDQGIVIIKDLSEWSAEERQEILGEAIKSVRRFFIISNTGTLLDTFRQYERNLEGDWAGAESQVLKSMESPDPTPLTFHDITFSVINLSMMDNLRLAESVFTRMIAPERWLVCEQRECRERCPVFRNVSLIRENETVARRRIFLLYRRLYEYGTRFTLRQLSAHLAYVITSGLAYRDIVKMAQRANPPKMSDFMFFNRFFGDNGSQRDEAAGQLPTVLHARGNGFGARPCPSWERRLWARTKGDIFAIVARGCAEEFRALRAVGAGLKTDEETTPKQAREQVRRMVYFLHDFGDRDDGTFVKMFLGSPMILDYLRWQEMPGSALSLGEQAVLKQRILHVLKEHFTGVRLPEGSTTDRHLFITLSRRSHEVRQSAQVVLARFPEDDLQLVLIERDDGAGNLRRNLTLLGRGGRIAASLSLELPFLDYVMMRNQGELGTDLLPSYVDRLDRFRGQLIQQAERERGDDIMLVRLRTNHTFRRQVFAVRGNRLEVTDG